MSTRYAYIPKIQNGVIFSDPYYNENSEGQYRKDFSDQNWLMRLNTFTNGQLLGFDLYIGRPTFVGSSLIKETGDGNYRIDFPHRYSAEAIQIDCTSPMFFCGSRDSWDSGKENFVIETGSVGELGSLYTFTCMGENAPAGFLLTGMYSGGHEKEDMLFGRLLEGFEGMEITQELYGQKASPDSLETLLLFAEEMRHAEATLNNKSQADKTILER